MVYIIKKHPYIIFLISVFISCNHIETEEDKYPDMPFLSDYTDPNIEIISLGYQIDSLYKNSEDTYITLGKGCSDFYETYVLEMDHNFVIQDSINAYGLFEILEDGSFYVNAKEGDMALKYKTIKSTPIEIKEHPFEGIKFQEEQATKIYNEYYDNGFPDSLFYTISDRVDSISFKKAAAEFKEQVFKDLQCVVYVRNYQSHPIFTYKDKEFITNSYPGTRNNDYGLGDEAPRSLVSTVAECKLMQSVKTINETNFTLIDQAVTGSGSGGGNHFSFGYSYAKGLQYFNMEIGGVATSFKVYAPYLSTININTRRIVDTEIYIIDIIHTDNDYHQHKYSYIARLKK